MSIKIKYISTASLLMLLYVNAYSIKLESFIPPKAIDSNLKHEAISFSALKENNKGKNSTFDDIKPEFIKNSCVSCHVNNDINLKSPPLLNEKGEKGDAYYLGGKIGTTFMSNSVAFEQPTKAIEEAGLSYEFLSGEGIFEGNFVANPHVPFGGLGPTYMQESCISCHPSYGRSKRQTNFDTRHGNGYIAFVHNPDGSPVKGYTRMLQTKAVYPFKPYAKTVKITWNEFKDKYNNTYPDGTPYNKGKKTEGSLSYPTADLVEPLLPLPEDYQVSLEATIGIFGTGLLDAIKDEDIIAEYERQHSISGPVKGMHGRWIKEPNGEIRLGKFDWHCNRATLENGPGANGVYSTANITREDRPNHYMTPEWLAKQKELGIDTSSIENPEKKEELSMKDFKNFMIWHRGLAVPAARKLDDPQVQKGEEIFKAIGCISCHKAEWTTGAYPHMPAYENQKIRPYTDLLLHDMGAENKGMYRTYRTPPLWGRGLMKTVANHTDMFHDLRARDFEEAILWHFGEAEFSRELFRHSSEADRAALIRFLNAL